MLVRRMVSLTLPQAVFIDAEAAKLGISVADVIRRILDEHRLTVRETLDPSDDPSGPGPTRVTGASA